MKEKIFSGLKKEELGELVKLLLYLHLPFVLVILAFYLF